MFYRCTQISLIERSDALNIADEMSTVDTHTFWSMVSQDSQRAPSPEQLQASTSCHITSTSCHMTSHDSQLISCQDTSRKSLKASHDDAPSSGLPSDTQEGDVTTPVFDANGAVSSSQFVFTKFGSDVPGIFTFNANNKSTTAETTTSNSLGSAR